MLQIPVAQHRCFTFYDLKIGPVKNYTSAFPPSTYSQIRVSSWEPHGNQGLAGNQNSDFGQSNGARMVRADEGLLLFLWHEAFQ